ncbi:hypothetical protein Lser_V15G14906 [Lactuca serriola]
MKLIKGVQFRVISISSRTVAPLKSRSRNSMVNHHQHSTSLFVPEVGWVGRFSGG